MIRCRRYISILMTAVVLGSTVGLSAAPLQILVTTYSGQAAAGTVNPAFIVLHLADAAGIPNTKAEFPKPSGDPIGGLELKGTKWRFQTLIVPPGYGQQFVQQGSSVRSFLSGQVRIVSMAPYGNNADGDAAAGLYVLQVIPAVGVRGVRKTQIPWVAGDYKYMISYIDGADEGTAFGVLTIR